MDARRIPHDLISKLSSRIAYGDAARLAELAKFDHGWSRDFAAGVGGDSEAIEREVMRRFSLTIHPKLSGSPYAINANNASRGCETAGCTGASGVPD